MTQAQFHIQDNLQFFLRPMLRGKIVTLTFGVDQSVKHLIESLGIPHTEIGLIHVNQIPVEFGHLVRNHEVVEVFGVSQEICMDEPRFIVDGQLGKLAMYLRMLGIDTQYSRHYHDDELEIKSVNEDRIVLSRDRHLLMRKTIIRGYCPRSLNPLEQIQEVLHRYSLQNWINAFCRCMHCNHLLEPVNKDLVFNRLEPLTKVYFNEFHICPSCDQVYWKGSHVEQMQHFVDRLCM